MKLRNPYGQSRCRSETARVFRKGSLTILVDGALFDDSGLSELVESWPQRSALAKLSGDVALTVWDDQGEIIWLLRTALSSRSLFYRWQGGRLDTSDIVWDLDAKHVDADALGEWISAPVGRGIASMFVGIDRVLPGTLVEIRDGVATEFRHSDFSTIAIDHGRSLDEAGALLRDAVDRAVADRLRLSNRVGTLLSSGRDSSIVSATVARQAVDGAVAAFTASPGCAVADLCQPLLADEAPLASVTAEETGVRHNVVIARDMDFTSIAEESYRFLPQPFGNPIAAYWWEATLARARRSGVTDLFTGGIGNLTVSDGGPIWLPDLLREDGIIAWARAFVEAARFPDTSVGSLINTSFGHHLPKLMAARLARGAHGQIFRSLLRGEARDGVRRADERRDPRPAPSSRALGAAMLNEMELADPASEHRFGMTIHDPTADPRVANVMLSNPARLMASPYNRRRILDVAFGDRLGPRVLQPARRAYQCLDWNLGFDVGALRRGLVRYADAPTVKRWIDLDRLASMLAEWPQGPLPAFQMIWQGDAIMRALSLAAFLFTVDERRSGSVATRDEPVSAPR